MDVYIIPKKMSGTGSIHDIASDQQDTYIRFKKGEIYAVVSSSYYNRGYTTHRTQKAAIRQSKKMQEYSHAIIDKNGDKYGIDFFNNAECLRKI